MLYCTNTTKYVISLKLLTTGRQFEIKKNKWNGFTFIITAPNKGNIRVKICPLIKIVHEAVAVKENERMLSLPINFVLRVINFE